MTVLLDVMAVRATGDPAAGLVECGDAGHDTREIACDILIVGDGTGYWFIDVGLDHPAFGRLQMAAISGEIEESPASLEAAALPLDVRRRFGL